MKRIFPAIKLRPQTPPIDKREIGDAAIPGERRIHTSSSAPPPQLGPLAHRVIILNRGSMPRKRTGRKWCNSSRPQCATSFEIARSLANNPSLGGGGGGWEMKYHQQLKYHQQITAGCPFTYFTRYQMETYAKRSSLYFPHHLALGDCKHDSNWGLTPLGHWQVYVFFQVALLIWLHSILARTFIK